MSADFRPDMRNFKNLAPFRFWCQKVLPTVYDDSLSYYEVLCKVKDTLNSVIENMDNLHLDMEDIYTAYGQLEDYVNHYFDNLDVQVEINNKLDVMALDGSLSALIAPFVEAELPGEVESRIDGVVAEQIGETVASQLPSEVGEQLPSEVATQVPSMVTSWLNDHVNPESEVIIDDSLSIQGAAADAKAAGDAIGELKSALNTMWCAVEWNPNIILGEYIAISSGIKANSDKYARTYGLWNGSGFRNAVYMPSATYEYALMFYDATGNLNDGTGYFGHTEYGTGLQYIPETAVKFGLSFRRYDQATLTESDITSFKSVLSAYSATDVTLSKNGKSADAKTVGDKFIDIDSTNDLTYELLPSWKYNWQVIGSDARPNGWTIGYVDPTDASTHYDEDYLRTRAYLFSPVSNFTKSSKFFKLTPPEGFFVYAVAVNASDNTVDHVLNADKVINVPIKEKTDPTLKYIFTIGPFTGGTAGTYADNAEFLSSIALRVYDDADYDEWDFSNPYYYDSTIEYALKIPPKYKSSGNKTPMIILCHGLSSTLDGEHWASEYVMDVVDEFAKNGYAVLDVNKVTDADWCNPDLIAKYVNAIYDAEQKFNVKATYIYAYSMGSLIGLALSSQYNIKSMVVSGLRLDLYARYALMSDAEKAIVDENLGFTDGYNAYECSGWNKTAYECIDANNALINPNTFPPTMFMWADGDTLTMEESLLRAEAIKRGGTIGDIKEYVGTHSQICALLAGTSMDDCLAWFAKWK